MRSRGESRQGRCYEIANKEFHEVIYAASRDDWVSHHVRSLRLRCAGYQRSRFELPGRLERSVEEHRVVFASIEAGNAEEARQAMLKHISVGGKDFVEFVSGLQPHLLNNN